MYMAFSSRTVKGILNMFNTRIDRVQNAVNENFELVHRPGYTKVTAIEGKDSGLEQLDFGVIEVGIGGHRASDRKAHSPDWPGVPCDFPAGVRS
jgi:hypothetical protein